MEPLPSGANFRRSKILWELGLHIAGNPATKYGGNRDMCITVGTGSGESFTPWLRMSTGSAMLTQAYRGVGLFDTPLPVRILGSYPSWDRFVVAIRKNTGFKSLHDVKK